MRPYEGYQLTPGMSKRPISFRSRYEKRARSAEPVSNSPEADFANAHTIRVVVQFEISWTLYDLRIQCGLLRPKMGNNTGFEIEEVAAYRCLGRKPNRSW
jgi:hypothetical protein